MSVEIFLDVQIPLLLDKWWAWWLSSQ